MRAIGGLRLEDCADRWGMTRATVDGQFLSSVYLSGNSEMRPALNLVVHKVVL